MTKINPRPVYSWSRKLRTASAFRLFATGYTPSGHSGPMQSMGESLKKSEKDPDPVQTVTVNKPERSVDDSNELLRKLVEMLTPGATSTARAPEPSVLDKLVQLLTEKAATRKPVSPAPAEPTKLETRLQTFFEGRQIPNQQFRPRPVRRDWSEVKCFSCGKSGHSATRCPTFDMTFPFILPGWKADKSSTGYVMVSPKMAMDRRRAENEN